MKITLQQIKDKNPCKNDWEKLLKARQGQGMGVEFPILEIIDSNGIKYAIWALRALVGKDRDLRLFACDCAESILPIFEGRDLNNKKARIAIDVARKYANGECTEAELNAAYAAAYDAAYAVYDACTSANAAAYSAAYAAANAAEIETQIDLFKKYFS